MGNILALPCDIGEVSDGYHSFNELYEHRCMLFMLLMSTGKYPAWVSKLHNDGSAIDDWFIGGVELPAGTITYHLPNEYWECVNNIITIEKLDRAKEWDGHTSSDVLNRIYSTLLFKALNINSLTGN
jgi:hypothetical protein